jgi:hypothetical protein
VPLARRTKILPLGSHRTRIRAPGGMVRSDNTAHSKMILSPTIEISGSAPGRRSRASDERDMRPRLLQNSAPARPQPPAMCDSARVHKVQVVLRPSDFPFGRATKVSLRRVILPTRLQTNLQAPRSEPRFRCISHESHISGKYLKEHQIQCRFRDACGTLVTCTVWRRSCSIARPWPTK